MFNQQKFGFDIPVVIGFLVLIVLLAFAQTYLAPVSKLPAPSGSKEQLVTHYVGDVALELPNSWAMDSIHSIFYLTGQKSGPQISFREIPAKTGQDAVKELAKNIELFNGKNKDCGLQTARFGLTDFSETLGRPAVVYIWEMGPNRYRQRKVGANTYTPLPGRILEITLELASPQAGLIFKYMETVDETDKKEKLEAMVSKQKLLIDWALDFIDHFQYSGYNSPQSQGFLATRSGRIDIRENPLYQHYNLVAKFSKKTNSPKVSDISFSLSSLPTQALSCGKETGMRKPAKPLGSHVRKKTTTHNSERIDLTWQNCSTNDKFSPSNRLFDIAYCGYAVDQDVLNEAEIIVMWDTLLNSLRILPDSN